MNAINFLSSIVNQTTTQFTLVSLTGDEDKDRKIPRYSLRSNSVTEFVIVKHKQNDPSSVSPVCKLKLDGDQGVLYAPITESTKFNIQSVLDRLQAIFTIKMEGYDPFERWSEKDSILFAVGLRVYERVNILGRDLSGKIQIESGSNLWEKSFLEVEKLLNIPFELRSQFSEIIQDMDVQLSKTFLTKGAEKPVTSDSSEELPLSGQLRLRFKQLKVANTAVSKLFASYQFCKTWEDLANFLEVNTIKSVMQLNDLITLQNTLDLPVTETAEKVENLVTV